MKQTSLNKFTYVGSLIKLEYLGKENGLIFIMDMYVRESIIIYHIEDHPHCGLDTSILNKLRGYWVQIPRCE